MNVGERISEGVEMGKRTGQGALTLPYIPFSGLSSATVSSLTSTADINRPYHLLISFALIDRL